LALGIDHAAAIAPASHSMTMVACATALLMTLAAIPDPAGPRCVIVDANVLRMSRTESTSPVSPPISTVATPSADCLTPERIAASSNFTEAGSQNSRMAAMSIGVTVLVSTMTDPGVSTSRSSVTTARDMSGAGSDSTIRRAAATSGRLPAKVNAPLAASSLMASVGRTS
jgi:hypothetical protein